jgi:hypothetical protein
MMVPEAAAICGLDDTAAPDLLYISDYTATNPENSIGFFDGARIQGAVSDVTGTPWLTLDGLVIEPGTADPSYDTDGDGTNDSDFNDERGGVIIVDLMDPARGSVCGIVTDVNLGTNQIKVDISTAGLGTLTGAYALTAVPALEYRIASNRLYRNNLLLADGIEDLQVTYFLDVNGNNAVDPTELKGDLGTNKYVANASDARTLRAVRFNLVARTRSEDDRYTQGFVQTTENRAVGGATKDGFRRRVHTSIVRMRNVGSRVEGT